jgi:probable rRNA maturation factor
VKPLPREQLVLTLQLVCASHRVWLPRHRVARWLRAALATPAQITVRVVDEAEGRELNRDFRGKDYATDVLTFDYQRTPVVLADVVLCAPVLARDAHERGLALDAHYAHLLVHGALHAQGFDHDTGPEARTMERRETRVLLSLGFADPWSTTA